MSDGLAGESNASPQAIATYYDEWVQADYDRDVTSWGYQAPVHAAGLVVERLAALPGSVLDAGCGTGQVGVALHERGVTDLVGGDFTPASVKAAQARGVYQQVDHLDLNQPLSRPDDEFAVVVSIGVFSYLADTAATIGELLRVTRAGGAVIFTQRTDLWLERDCDNVIGQLEAAGACTATMSDPQPYLPGHPEFADDIGIIYTTLTKSER